MPAAVAVVRAEPPRVLQRTANAHVHTTAMCAMSMRACKAMHLCDTDFCGVWGARTPTHASITALLICMYMSSVCGGDGLQCVRKRCAGVAPCGRHRRRTGLARSQHMWRTYTMLRTWLARAADAPCVTLAAMIDALVDACDACSGGCRACLCCV